MDGFLLQALVYLAAGVIAVPIAKRLGLGSVLGYLAAGLALGPILGLVHDTHALQEFAEFGVVMMLFLIGLELEPRKLWLMRDRLFGLGSLQVLLTAAAVGGVVLAFGRPWQEAAALGLILSLSSTAIVLQTLQEKGLMQTDGGRSSFAALLFQDIAVIPILAILPFLAVAGLVPDAALAPEGAAAHAADAGWISGLPSWMQGAVIVAAIGGVIIFGRYLTRPAFRFIAESRLSEIFTAAALLLVVGIAWLMTMVGLSPALGAFVAGVVLADSEFRHELESDIEPFKGLLLGLFFITVGAGIQLSAVINEPVRILGLTLGLMAIKFAVLLVLGYAFRLKARDRMMMAMGLAQGGEFAFVLFGFAGGMVLAPDTVRDATLVVALSMLATPLLFLLYERVVAPRIEAAANRRVEDDIDERGAVVIAGIGRFGQIVNRMLTSQGYETVIIDHESEMVDTVSMFETRAFYGDASRPEMLRKAGIADARLFVVAVNEREAAIKAVRWVKQTYPGVHVLARAYDRVHYYELKDAGADTVVRELFGSSLRAAELALVAMGVDPQVAERAREVFRTHDEETLEELYRVWEHDVDVTQNATYLETARKRTAMLRDALTLDREAEEDLAKRA
jgi:CPA2 family monovalent cation:H+ antiporter-2/glutathione-regulated potassium-efflux system ancillary protein KefC